MRCDTEFESGRPYTPTELLQAIQQYPGTEIVWTGGEPLQQLTAEVVAYFKENGYYQCVETSGLLPVSRRYRLRGGVPKKWPNTW